MLCSIPNQQFFEIHLYHHGQVQKQNFRLSLYQDYAAVQQLLHNLSISFVVYYLNEDCLEKMSQSLKTKLRNPASAAFSIKLPF